MKQLKFEHQFAEAIQEGSKTATFRVNDDKDLRVGDEVELVDKVDRDHPITWEVPGLLLITAVEEVPLASLGKENFIRAETFSSKEEMIAVFRRFYGEHVDETTSITVLTFRYQPYEQPRKFLQETVDGSNSRPQKARLFADGGSRGNPGPSASGFVVMDEHGEVLHADNHYLGITTNNQAEYHAVLSGMRWCAKQGIRELDVFLDSLLVVNQMKGKFRVKNRDLWSLHETVKEEAAKFRRIHFNHIPREMNKLADAEVNHALDAVKGSDIVQ